MTRHSHTGKSETDSAERISEAEHAVMEALWTRSPQTAAEVCKTVCKQRGWSMPTVKTLLSRLVQKGALETQPDGRRYLYSPLIARSSYVGTESKRLVERLFGGRAAPLFAHLAESEALSEDDIAEIERLLQEMRK
ncbi:BlaI/MecI/CopY family transcriptional regulator [Aurantiacibacter poecillastricola]|uniref:BlaI/MecI/CopY family transcriptional regulator n=1 Tax=Aurantiacibacter poecillastricola TaxID=3064385 RepID=UPI00273F2CDC|nr:BlaI/MecI/CopY family transcriptional regulator [Aurantiacibacter sp. 219JJ12-13]MDP5261836.1 BlaI/MecI/CopY family transcriptional regulator [Aurantiacibacter sp. 219JJ12-13]